MFQVARLETQTNIMRMGIRELHTQAQRLDNRIYRTHESITRMNRFLTDQLVPLIAQNKPIRSRPKQRQSSDTVPRRQDSLQREEEEAAAGYSSSTNFQSLSEGQMEDVTAALREMSRHLTEYPASPDRLFNFHKPPEENLLRYEVDGKTIYYFVNEGPTKSLHQDDNIICMFGGELEAFYLGNLSDAELQKPRNADGNVMVKVDIPFEHSSWETDWPEYDPPDYTSPYVYHYGRGSRGKGFKWAHDPDITKCSISTSSHEHPWENEAHAGPCSRPINPLGRVGVRGRGLLGKWGPNLAIDQVVTRWKRNENQIQVERRGKPILEVVLCKRVDTGEWAFPGGFQGMDDGVNPLIRKVFGLEPDTIQDNEDLQEVEAILKSSKLFYQGLTCDPRDTDNAWVESRVMHVHDDTNILSKYEMTEGSNPAIKFVSWATIHKDMVMFANVRTENPFTRKPCIDLVGHGFFPLWFLRSSNMLHPPPSIRGGVPTGSLARAFPAVALAPSQHTKIIEKIAEQMNALW